MQVVGIMVEATFVLMHLSYLQKYSLHCVGFCAESKMTTLPPSAVYANRSLLCLCGAITASPMNPD
jgi:hypothetical protein